MSVKEPIQYQRHSHRREWSMILLLLLLAVVFMFTSSQYALAFLPSWQVSADMSSLINPDGTIAAYSGGSRIEPVDQRILTPYSFNYLTPAPTKGAFMETISTSTAESIQSSATETVPTSTATTSTLTSTPTTSTLTRTATSVASQTSTKSPTATLLPTKTKFVIYYTPSFTRTSIGVPASTATRTFTRTSTPSRTTSATRTRTRTTTFTATRTGTRSATATSTRTGTRSVTATATRTDTRTRTYTATRTSTRTSTTTATPTWTHSMTVSPSETYTPTDSPTASPTLTPTDTPTPSETPTPTETFTPSETPTPSLTFTPTNTPTYTPTITSPTCSTNNPGAINIGPGDGICTTITSFNSFVIDLGSTPITTHGDGGWDFIYYERAADPGIQMDLVTLEISSDGSTWYTVFAYGNGIYYNSSISAYPQADNTQIPLSDLIGGGVRTGVGIDIDNAALNGGLGIPPGSYRYLRIFSPADSDGGCDADAIEVIL